ncbi:MAG: hypothetical protein RLZZ383_1935 [Pseudomonadota bacterium]
MDAPTVAAQIARVRRAVASAWVGSSSVLDAVLLAWIAGGHALVEDVPGVGKTSLALALAAATGLRVGRVQGTGDLLPSDLTGAATLDPGSGTLRFQPGPIHTELLVVDELNRMSPRTQSALLEAMAERAVTVDGVRHALPGCFFVLATQNPEGAAGTWPLPDSQLDRFLVRGGLGYPDREGERRLLRGPLPLPTPCVGVDDVARWQQAALSVGMTAELEDALLDVVAATRAAASVQRGVSPRGAAAWSRAVRAAALMAGRSYVVPDDLAATAPWVLPHRICARRPGAEPAEVSAIVAERLRALG